MKEEVYPRNTMNIYKTRLRQVTIKWLKTVNFFAYERKHT